jgi:UDP-GlcNAc:undecaprenyl-phosphate GlcNAc-1-phosphate transferase
VAIPVLAFSLPVVDTAVTIGRRLLSGKPIFEGDREHIHHMLLARGWSQRRVVLALYAVSAAFGLTAMLFVNPGSTVPAIVLFVVGVAIVLALGNLRYHEVDELRASVRRNLSDRRLRAINNLRIRRACQSMSTATDLSQLFDAVLEVAAAGEFVSAAAELSLDGQVMVNARAVELAHQELGPYQLRMHEGRVEWKWQRSKSETDLPPRELWTIRLPISDGDCKFGYLDLCRPVVADPLLFDVNYLSNVLQPALFRATQKIFDQAERSIPRQRVATAR